MGSTQRPKDYDTALNPKRHWRASASLFMLMSAAGGLSELTAQEFKSFSSFHPAVIRSSNVPFTPISDDLYQRATDGANVQTALKAVVDKSSPQKLGLGVLYVPCLKSELTWTDTSAKLRWSLADNGSDINWYAAKEYCRNLTLGGLRSWRLPTIAELATIWSEYNDSHMKGGIQVKYYPWSSSVTPDNSGTAFYYVFGDNFQKGKQWADVRTARYMRALCVHSAER